MTNYTMRYHCYIAGPYSLGDTEKNVYTALEAADRIIAEFRDEIAPIVPHLSYWWDKHSPKPAQWWYDYTMEQCLRCDILLRLDGKSVGSDEEVRRFSQAGKPVVYSMDQLGAWLNARKLVAGYSGGDDQALELAGMLEGVQVLEGLKRPEYPPLPAGFCQPVAYFDAQGKPIPGMIPA